ncbi:MAG: PAS domain S-box protein [Methanoregula sp.]|nr:PAS domain S-box protein [Methanoregula sp.]
MPVFDQEKVDRLKQTLKWHPRGITISDLATKMEMNRNLVAKYLDILLISGQVEMQVMGAAKVYFLTQRIPISSMLEFSSDMVIILDSAMTILQVNEPLLVQLNEKKEAFVGWKIKDVDHPFFNAIPVIDPSKGTDPVHDQVREFECTFDGKEHNYKIKQLRTAFEDGSNGIILIIEDITTQTAYQKMLELSEAQYRGIVEDQTEFITRFLPDGTLVFVNDAYARYLGKKKEELLGKQHIPDLGSDDMTIVHQSIHSLNTENPVITFECRIHHSSGQIRWNLWTVRVLFDDNRNPLEYQGVGKDNTEKREAETRINEYIRDMEFLSRKAQEFVGLSPDTDIFKTIGQSLSELLPSAVISVNSYDPLSNIITVRAVFSDRDHELLNNCLTKEYIGFQFPLGTIPAPLKTLAISSILEGKLFYTDESLYNFFFQQIPIDICERIKETLNLGDRYYGIGLVRHGRLFGIVTFSLRKGETVPNSSLIETFVRQVSISLHRRIIEDSLRNSEAQYRGIVEDQTEFITRFLPDGTLVFVNDAYARYLGKKKEELLGRQHIPDIVSDDMTTVHQSINELNTENPVIAFECRIHHSSGQIRWNVWTVRALFDDNQKPMEYQGVGRDNTEKREAATRINQYIRDMEFLSRKAQEFVGLSLDADIFLTIAQGLSEIIPDALITVNSIDVTADTLTVRAVLPDRDRELLTKYLGKDPLGFQFKISTLPEEKKIKFFSALQAGRLVHVEENLHSLLFQQIPEDTCDMITKRLDLGDSLNTIGLTRHGITFGSVSILSRKGKDTTNSSIIEMFIQQASIVLHRRRTDDALKESEKLYRSVIENIQDVFYRSDKEGNLIMASPSWARMLGYDSLEDCIGFNIAEKFYFEPQCRKEFLDAVYNNGSVSDYEVVLKRRDGSPLYVSTNSHLFYDDTGPLIGVEGIVRDISERHIAAERIRNDISRLEFFSQKMQEFIELPPDSDIYFAIGKGLKDLLPDSMIIVNNYDRNTGMLTIKALVGDKAQATALKYLQSDLTDISLYVDEPVPEIILAGKIYPVQKNFLSILSQNFSQDVSTAIVQELNLGNFYYISLVWEGSFLGNITFGLPKGEKLEKIPFIEIYGKAASIVLQRKIAEESLKESQEIFSNVATYAPVPIAIIEADGRYQFVNQKFIEIFGYDLDDFKTGREWFSLAYPDPVYRKNVIDTWKSDLDASRSGQQRPRTYTVRCKNGVNRQIVFRPVTLSDNKQCVVYEDVTEQHMVDQVQNLLSTIVENSPDAIISKNIDGTITSWNQAAERFYGYKKDEILGRNITTIIPKERYGEIEEVFTRIKNGEFPVNLETLRVRKDGTIIDITLTISPIIDKTGTIIGTSTIARNTPFIRSEERLQGRGEQYCVPVENMHLEDPEGRRIGTVEMTRDISKTGERHAVQIPKAGDPDSDDYETIEIPDMVKQLYLSNALKMARDYIAILDRSGKCLWVNDALVSAVNAASCNDLAGKSIALYIAPEFRKLALDALMDVKKSGNKTVPFMMLSSSGRVPVEANISAINTEEGDLFGYMAIARHVDREKIEKPR